MREATWLQKVHPPRYHWFVESRTAPFIAREVVTELVKGQCRHSVNDDTVTLLVYPLNILPVIVTT
nr:hypothetical protein [Escherichia coli]